MPRERRPELGHEMAHARLAAGDPVGLEQAHLGPAQAEGIADHVVEGLDVADVVLDQPEGLAPQRLQQPVADEGVDLPGDVDALHAHRLEERDRVADRLRRSLPAADDLDQRQEIDRVVGMGDEQPLRMPQPRLQVARQEARGRGADQGIRPGRGVDLPEHPLLQVDALRHALLDPVGIRHRLGDARMEGQGAAGRQRRPRQSGIGDLGIGDDLADDPLGLRMGVEERDVDAGEKEAGDPASADDAAADAGGFGEGRAPGRRAERVRCHRAHHRRSSRSFSRTAAGERMRLPMPSAIVTARATRSPFEARTPFSSQMLSSRPTRMLPPAARASAA